MKKSLRQILRMLILLMLTSCLEPYQPPDIPTNISYLVVDGFLNSSDGSITVRLSRTNAISNPASPPGEPGAGVVLEQRNVRNYNLVDQGGGLYNLSGISINPGSQYRLRMNIKNRIYLSDYVDVIPTPPIDSVYWAADPVKSGVQVNVASHDPVNKKGFYQWDFIETWKHDAFFLSAYTIQKGVPTLRPLNQYIYTCWSTENSSKILITSTEKLSTNRVQFPVTFMDKGNKKISSIHGVYSILVRQHSISETAYNFWLQLQKTTEDLGGLFDPLPNQVVGNMHGPTGTTDPVLGYFSAGSVSEKRIYIDVLQLPSYLRISHDGCTLRDLEGPGTPPLSALSDGYPLVTPSPATTAEGNCIDCRFDGGTTTKPPFWP